MVYWLIELASTVPGLGALNAFHYISLRTGGAMVTAALLVFLFGLWIVGRLSLGRGRPTSLGKPAPAMGGLVILSGLVVSTLLWTKLGNLYIWIILAVVLGFGAVGFDNDHLKAARLSHRRFAGKSRLLIEAAIALAACYALLWLGRDVPPTSLAIPFLAVIFGAFVMVGAGNVVNLTDGRDGLAIVSVIIAAASFAVISYLTGNVVLSDYLQIDHVAGTGELAVLCGAALGGSLGFLWLNPQRAQILLDDTGSLALGGLLGATAVAVGHEIVLAIIGSLLLLEKQYRIS